MQSRHLILVKHVKYIKKNMEVEQIAVSPLKIVRNFIVTFIMLKEAIYR